MDILPGIWLTLQKGQHGEELELSRRQTLSLVFQVCSVFLHHICAQNCSQGPRDTQGSDGYIRPVQRRSFCDSSYRGSGPARHRSYRPRKVQRIRVTRQGAAPAHCDLGPEVPVHPSTAQLEAEPPSHHRVDTESIVPTRDKAQW